jgi:hypothetical protein
MLFTSCCLNPYLSRSSDGPSGQSRLNATSPPVHEMDMRGAMIGRIDHHPDTIETQNGWHRRRAKRLGISFKVKASHRAVAEPLDAYRRLADVGGGNVFHHLSARWFQHPSLQYRKA